MNHTNDCERVRMELMAVLDGETEGASSLHHAHLTGCASCRQWHKNLESLSARLQGLSYQDTGADLWPAVETQVQQLGAPAPVSASLWPIAVLVVVWRALQLLMDLPLPMLHPIVPAAAAIWAVWRLAGDPLAIETFAPELQKRGL